MKSIVVVFLKATAMADHVNNQSFNMFNNCAHHKSQSLYTHEQVQSVLHQLQQQYNQHILILKQNHQQQINTLQQHYRTLETIAIKSNIAVSGSHANQ